MTRSYWPLILVLASAWGASYLFIKVGVEGGFSPGALMAARALLAGVVLFGYLAVIMGSASAISRIRDAWRESLVLGLLNAALPFWLVAWGETHIDSSVAAIARQPCRSSRCSSDSAFSRTSGSARCESPESQSD